MLETLQFIDSDYPWFFAAWAFIFGAIVGSFLNVCIYRIPAERSVISPGSTCACGKPIAWYDNVPILSWLILRGRARCCRQPYSIRYPLVELLTGLLFLAAWHAHSPLKAICLMALISMLICGSFIDLDHMEIPNRFSIGLAIVGFALSILVPDLHLQGEGPYASAVIRSAFESMQGTLIGSGLILWIALLAETVLRKEAMGFGDVKLLGGIGAFLGWQGAVFSIFGGAVIGCIGLLVWMAFKKIRGAKPEEAEEDQLLGRHIPFGPMLSSGALLYALLLEKQVGAYFAEVSTLLQ